MRLLKIKTKDIEIYNKIIGICEENCILYIKEKRKNKVMLYIDKGLSKWKNVCEIINSNLKKKSLFKFVNI